MKVLIVDDHELIRKGIKMFLSSECQTISHIYEAKNGTAAVMMASRYQPDIVLMDISMPDGLNGFMAAKHILGESKGTKIIVLTMHDEESYIKEALKNGIHGYLLKNSETNEIKQAMKTVLTGRRYYKTNLPKEQLQRLMANKGSVLTPREKEVVQLTSLGYTNIQIGEQLSISPKTVENHKANVMEKLNLTERYELVQYALKNSLIG